MTIYGAVTIEKDTPTSEVCDENGKVAKTVMCPQCRKSFCDYWYLGKRYVNYILIALDKKASTDEHTLFLEIRTLSILCSRLQIHAGHLHGGQQRTISIYIFFLLYSCIAYLVDRQDSNVPNLCFSSFSFTVAVTCGSPIWLTTR